MGSTSIHRDKGQTTRQIIQGELSEQYEIIASAMTGSVFNAAVRDNRTGKVEALVVLTWRSREYFNFTFKVMDEGMGPNEANATAKILDLLSPLPECHHDKTYCLLCNQEIRQDGERWVYDAKAGQVPECGGPRCYHYSRSNAQPDGSAPFHQPGGHGWCSVQSAREWRAACRERLARIERSKAITRGTKILFPQALKFASGHESDRFEYVEKDTFRGVLGLGLYRITGWREMAFEVLAAA